MTEEECAVRVMETTHPSQLTLSFHCHSRAHFLPNIKGFYCDGYIYLQCVTDSHPLALRRFTSTTKFGRRFTHGMNAKYFRNVYDGAFHALRPVGELA